MGRRGVELERYGRPVSMNTSCAAVVPKLLQYLPSIHTFSTSSIDLLQHCRATPCRCTIHTHTHTHTHSHTHTPSLTHLLHNILSLSLCSLNLTAACLCLCDCNASLAPRTYSISHPCGVVVLPVCSPTAWIPLHRLPGRLDWAWNRRRRLLHHSGTPEVSRVCRDFPSTADANIRQYGNRANTHRFRCR
jgi:hypothetical protein